MRHARAVPPLRSFSEASLRVQSGRGPLRSGAKRAAVLQRTAAGAAAYGRWRAVRSAAAPNARTHSKAQARFPGSQRVQTQGLDFGIQARGCRVCGESERMPPARTATTTGRQIASAETGAACGSGTVCALRCAPTCISTSQLLLLLGLLTPPPANAQRQQAERPREKLAGAKRAAAAMHSLRAAPYKCLDWLSVQCAAAPACSAPPQKLLRSYR